MGCFTHALRAAPSCAPASIIQSRMVPRRDEGRFGPGRRGSFNLQVFAWRGRDLRPGRFPKRGPAGREVGGRFVSDIFSHNADAFMVRFKCIHHRIIWTSPSPSGVHRMRNLVNRVETLIPGRDSSAASGAAPGGPPRPASVRCRVWSTTLGTPVPALCRP